MQILLVTSSAKDMHMISYNHSWGILKLAPNLQFDIQYF